MKKYSADKDHNTISFLRHFVFSVFNVENRRPGELAGLYLKAVCNGLDHALQGYRNKIVDLEKEMLKDPDLSVAHLLCQLQQVGFFVLDLKLL